MAVPTHTFPEFFSKGKAPNNTQNNPHLFLLLGCLSNGDGNGNENGRKAIGLDSQNNNFARASRLYVHFLAVVSRQRESA